MFKTNGLLTLKSNVISLLTSKSIFKYLSYSKPILDLKLSLIDDVYSPSIL